MFNPREFRAIAGRCVVELADGRSEETDAAYRTAIGRAYYAAFLTVLDHLQRDYGFRLDPNRGSHQQVLDELEEIDIDAWETLDRLRALRVDADYDFFYQSARSDVKDAFKYSDEVIEWVN